MRFSFVCIVETVYSTALNVASSVQNIWHSHIHLHFWVEVIYRTGGKDCCPLAVDQAQVVYEKDVAGGVYAKLHS